MARTFLVFICRYMSMGSRAWCMPLFTASSKQRPCTWITQRWNHD